MTTKAIANDLTETLNYAGVDTNLLLVRVAGLVTGVSTGENVVYVSDGVALTDGVGGFAGIRVHIPTGAAMPNVGDFISVTGIARPEMHVLPAQSTVNGTLYGAGTTVYVPSVWGRVSSDIQTVYSALSSG